jgi:predicted DNA-binding transcriptional regulator AlpA
MPTKRFARAAEQRQPLRVFSFHQFCELSGFSPRTGRRLIESGDGPKITKLSDRRIGIREDHYREWLDSRVVR